MITLNREEQQKIFDVLETLSQRIGDVAPGPHENFYADYNDAWGILRRGGITGPSWEKESES